MEEPSEADNFKIWLSVDFLIHNFCFYDAWFSLRVKTAAVSI
jgi:hypothetical protein